MNLPKSKLPSLPLTGFFLVLLLGVVYSFLIPICQVPDEETHVKYICESIGLEGVHEQYVEIARPYITSLIYNQESVDIAAYKELYQIPLDYEQIRFNGSFKISLLKYLPQLAGLLLGLLFHVPIMVCLHIVEITSAVFSAVICYHALKIMPVKREVFMAIMLLPMSLQQYGSFNYDVTLLPLCFLALALMLDMQYQGINVKKCILLGICSLFISITKPPYACLLIMMAALLFRDVYKQGKLDRSKYKERLLWLAMIMLPLAFVAGAGLYLLRNVSRVSILVAALMNPRHYIHLFHVSVKIQWWLLLQQIVGYLGWFDTQMPVWYIWFVVVSLFVMAFMGKKKTYLSIRICSFVILFTVIHLIFISMLSHTFMLNGYGYDSLEESRESLGGVGMILGVQGRYFIPILMNLFLLIGPNLIKNIKFIFIFQIGYYAIAIITPIVVILQRFWFA